MVKPETEKQLKSLPFQVSGRIMSLLGEDSVTNKLIAINELVKNAYDADATKVILTFENLSTNQSKLTIQDNGTGMSYLDLESNWMILGTDNKKLNEYSAKLNRRKIGHKGIGRLSLQNLSKQTILTSCENKYDGIRLEVNWKDFEKPDNLVVDVKNSVFSISSSNAKKGTTLELIGLKHSWKLIDIEELERNLALIFPIDIGSNKFKIDIIAKEFGKFSTDIDQTILKENMLVLHAKLDAENNATFTLQHKKIKKKEVKYFSALRCGPIVFTLFFYYRIQGKLDEFRIKSDLSYLKTFLDSFGGVKIYRDDVRVTGYGDTKKDWLQLNSKRLYDSKYPGNNQVLGFVKITSEDNPKLVDTTTREGIIEGQALDDMMFFLDESLQFFTQEREYIFAQVPKVTTTKKTTKTITTTKKTEPKNKNKAKNNNNASFLLDFNDNLPYASFERLEKEINYAYNEEIPNGCFLLCRKLVENLIYEILYQKFNKDTNLRFNTNINQAHPLSILISNLSKKKKHFEADDRKKIETIVSLAGKFRKDVNKSSHDIMAYLSSTKELEPYKISIMVDHCLFILDNV